MGEERVEGGKETEREKMRMSWRNGEERTVDEGTKKSSRREMRGREKKRRGGKGLGG